jgi:signal transduction histidine kinase
MDGEGEISLTLSNEGEWVTIDLTDSGKGIAPSKHKKIFEPGYSTKKRGWGLGLSLAKRIIEQYHKGKIFVRKSNLNKGTTFYIQLPAVNR